MIESFAGLIGRIDLGLCQAPVFKFATGFKSAAFRIIVGGDGDSLVTPRFVTQQLASRRSVCLNIKASGWHSRSIWRALWDFRDAER